LTGLQQPLTEITAYFSATGAENKKEQLNLLSNLLKTFLFTKSFPEL